MINVDTDMIIPKQFLKTIKRTGLGKNLFDEMRYDDGRQGEAGFRARTSRPTARPRSSSPATISAAARRREHAPWALLDFGIRCVIAPSFADIFYNNCFKNGILPITLPQDERRQADGRRRARRQRHHHHRSREAGDHAAPTAARVHFEIDPFRKHCLLNGLDDIGLTLEKAGRSTASRPATSMSPALAGYA